MPYVAASVGAIRASGRVTAPGLSVSMSGTEFAFGVGGGLRYYAGERWGIRPEVKIFASDETYVRVAIGVFYQFQ